ncbi:hypothetical protein PM8797T_18489 [Gimesia maris DSM 8797]|nr:hypothetical protein PM8797T_18489 [Gimesia maris DSM 8797]
MAKCLGTSGSGCIYLSGTARIKFPEQTPSWQKLVFLQIIIPDGRESR